jgi:hypothetical protein
MGSRAVFFAFIITADLWVPEECRQAIGAISRTVRRV